MLSTTSDSPSDPDPAPGSAQGSAQAGGHYLPETVVESVKILIVGAFGVGKTTLISSVSEIEPLRTEESITQASEGIDSLEETPEKTTTTVAMDFGRITLTDEIALYLFGTPGQRRFWDLWSGLAEGAAGALVMVDTRRLQDSFEVLDQLETRTDLPFVVAINQFPGAPSYEPDQIRTALDLDDETPIIVCNAKNRNACARALAALVRHALKRF